MAVQSRVLLLRALRRTYADQSWRAHREFALLLDRSSVFAVTPPNGDSPRSGFVGYYPHSIQEDRDRTSIEARDARRGGVPMPADLR